MDREAGLDVAQAFPVGQLGEGHGPVLLGAGKRPEGLAQTPMLLRYVRALQQCSEKPIERLGVVLLQAITFLESLDELQLRRKVVVVGETSQMIVCPISLQIVMGKIETGLDQPLVRRLDQKRVRQG